MNRNNKKMTSFFFLLSLMVLFSGCGSDRAGEIEEKQVAGVVERDSDGDGVIDSDEINIYFTDPLVKDSDGDGLDDKYEIDNGLNPNITDTDGDGLNDGDEVNTHHTDPKNRDSDGDGLDDKYEIYNGLNPNLADTDGDGLDDGDEINTYDTNPKELDTDGDGLTDGEEVFNIGEPTNPRVKDSDNDGLEDGVEVSRNDLNATNSDSDGDCLLDKYEIEFYHTEANNTDTDGDGVADGIEVYSYVSGELNTTCLTTPETLSVSYNASPAMDNVPQPDKINALDPTNDSDGDGQANIAEGSCGDGDALDSTKECPYITESISAQALQEYGYVYMPGGFDVNADGINEGGFWLSSYQARKSDVDVNIEEVKTLMGDGYNQYIVDNFTLTNVAGIVTDYTYEILDDFYLQTSQLLFKKSEIENKIRYTSLSPYTMMAALKSYIMTDTEGNTLNIPLHIMSLKQYVQVRMLLEADIANGGDGKVIRNGLLGNDANVPLVTYSIEVYEFGESYKEYTSTLVQLKENSNNNVIFTLDDIKDWWSIDIDTVVRNTDSDGNQDGANSVIDVGFQTGVRKDNYAVIVMGGHKLNLTQGTAGMEEDSSGTTNGIGFRSASGYID